MYRDRSVGRKHPKGASTFQNKKFKMPTSFNTENKFFDTIRGASSPTTSGTIVSPSLNLIAAGTKENERIGRKCTVHSVHLRGTVNMPTSSIPLNERIRVIIYCDKQNNGGAVAVTTTDLLETASVNSFRNLSNSGRFNFLQDQTFTFNQQAGSGADTTTDTYPSVLKTFKWNKKLNLDLEFSDITGTLGELRSNNIGVFAISTNGLSVIEYTARLRFTG